MIALRDLTLCFEGIVPATIATAAADGTPNVTFLSRVHLVDDDHVATSNQFFSKTQRNLAENPLSSVIVVDARSYEQYKLLLRFERTERRGPLFDRMHVDIEAVAALTGMTGVFKLRGADVHRVLDVVRL